VTPRRGLLYYARLDQRRLVLVISPDVRNAGAPDVLVIPVSPVLSTAPTHVRLRAGEGGLRVASLLKCEQLTNLDKGALDAEPIGAALAEPRLRMVERALLRAIGVPVPLEAPVGDGAE
jgi:mRNA-degrading endonuclease toxin of MazEF toxin-antitoxin module